MTRGLKLGIPPPTGIWPLDFYIHGFVHLESNLIIVQKDVTVFSLLYFCRQLYIFRVLTSIIRKSYNCNYSFWYWLTRPTPIRSRDATVFSLLYFCRQLHMFRVLTPIIRSSYNCNYSFCYWLTGPTSIRSRDANFSVFYTSVGSSTCFGCWHPSSRARTTVITASGID